MVDALQEVRHVNLEIQEGERTVISPKVQQFLALAMKRWRTIAETEAGNRQEMLEDLRFRASDQWPDTVKNNRQTDNRPCLTINRLPEFIRQVTNAQRQNRPAVKVNPVDSAGDVETAQVFQGLIRHIENISNADVAYTQAGEHQTTMGRGYWRILTEYESDRSDKQQIRIKRIINPFSVYMDVSCNEADLSDARYAFIIEDIPKEEFKVRWPDASFASLTEFATMGDQGQDWLPEGKIRVAEYFYTEYVKRELVTFLLPGGEKRQMFREEWEKLNAAGHVENEVPSSMWQEVAVRKLNEKKVKWALISAGAILEGNKEKDAGRDWAGKFIPIVQCVGDEIDINGQKDYRGLVRDARDPQRMINYWESALTEAIALAPRAPFIVAKGQIENFEAQWDSANVRNWPYLQYNNVSAEGGQPLPAPARQTFEPAIQAISQAAMHADQNLKNVTGFHASSLGDMAPSETSGKAIQALQKQAELGASNYLDNLGRAIRYTGEILVDLIPKVYDTPRVMRILGEDEQTMQVAVYAGEGNAPPGMNPDEPPPGIRGLYQLDVGVFDVTVQVGRSFETRRQEAVSTITDLFKGLPEVAPLGMDILVENMDVPWGRQLAARLKTQLPPALQEEQEHGPAAQAEINQLKGQLEEATQAAQAMAQQIETDEHKERVKLEGKQIDASSKAATDASRERIAAGKDAAASKVAADDQDNQLDIAKLNAKVDLLIAQLGAAVDREKLDLDAEKTQLTEDNKRAISKERPAPAKA